MKSIPICVKCVSCCGRKLIAYECEEISPRGHRVTCTHVRHISRPLKEGEHKVEWHIMFLSLQRYEYSFLVT